MENLNSNLMNKISTKHIEFWPVKVVLGFAEINESYSSGILSAEELKEYNNFTNKKRQAEFLTARHLFQSLLSDQQINSSEVELMKEEMGKPFATHFGTTIYVSFSHSPSKVFCAISKTFDVGLDVENVSRKVNPAVVKRILNEEEAHLAKEEEPIRLWTIKEAAVKCLGTGLRTNLDDLTIQKNEKNRFSVRFNNDKMFEICSFRETDHQIALAYQSKHI
jgi:phosphopantetheinyl transferase